MTAVFYGNFSKRRNSTKQPTGGTTKTVVLKEGTSVIKPSFLLTSPVLTWNYCSAFGNYYYIRDIVLETNDLFRVECELDVLATFKNAIGNYTTLVSRADSNWNSTIYDRIYPTKALPVVKYADYADSLFTNNYANGTIIVAAVGGRGQKIYAMSVSQFEGLCMVLFPSLGVNFQTWLVASVNEAAVGGLNSVLSSIQIIKWLPVSFSAVSALGLSTVTEVWLGNFGISYPTGVYTITGSTTVSTFHQMTFPDRDDLGARGDWLYSAPFANYNVYVPAFGMIEVDGTYLLPTRSVNAGVVVEMLSGNARLGIDYVGRSGSADKRVGYYNANLSFDIKAGGASSNLSGFASGVASAIAAYATENYAAMVGAIAGAAENLIPKPTQIGGGISGPIPGIANPWSCEATYFDPIDENRTELGRPLAEVIQINTLSGFVKCANASLSIPGHAEEMSEVNGFLNGGFFYE